MNERKCVWLWKNYNVAFVVGSTGGVYMSGVDAGCRMCLDAQVGWLGLHSARI